MNDQHADRMFIRPPVLDLHDDDALMAWCQSVIAASIQKWTDSSSADPSPGQVPRLDADGGEWTPPDDYDAVAIRDMAVGFKADPTPGHWPIESAWAQTRPHPIAGQIKYCWENPTAWEILDGDVDQEWFMRMVIALVDLPPRESD